MHYNVVKMVLQIANSHQDIELTFAHINKKQSKDTKKQCFKFEIFGADLSLM